MLFDHINKEILKYDTHALKEIKKFKRKDVWGFTGNKEFEFLRLSFYNLKAFKITERYFQKNPITISGIISRSKFKLYESNIEPFIRFISYKGYCSIRLD